VSLLAVAIPAAAKEIDLMFSKYFEAPERIALMRATCIGPYLDGFSLMLSDAGYSPLTIRSYIGIADHVGRWAEQRGIDVESWDDDMLVRFSRHLLRCKCSKSKKRNKGVFKGTLAAVRLLLAHLRAIEVIVAAQPTLTESKYAAISDEFARWMVRHRGVVLSTVTGYQRALEPFLGTLGEDPKRYTVPAMRTYVIERLSDVGRREARDAVTAIRAFLRFLVAEGRVDSRIPHSVPTVPQWRLSTLPRYLEVPEVERVVKSCDLTTGHGLRDHAVLLLLARLGLRAGDIVTMTVADIDWRDGTLRVRGKGRREVRLPLPQDVGDAVLAYLERGRPMASSDRLFLTVFAPTRPFATSATVSDIVRFALKRAGIQNPPSRGAHLLRHSAATAMLRSGGSLETVAMILRHRSPDMTAYYAKVDVAMLQLMAQPWPGGAAC
jgi:integrase/recombinase XerD